MKTIRSDFFQTVSTVAILFSLILLFSAKVQAQHDDTNFVVGELTHPE